MTFLRRLWPLAALVALASVTTRADDASTVVQSDARIRMKAELASGKSVTIRAFDGDLSSIGYTHAPHKIAVSARLLDSDKLEGDIQLYFWLLTKGPNGHESMTVIEKHVTRAGATSVTPASVAVSKVVRSLAVLDVAPPAAPESGAAASENAPSD